MSDLNQGNQQIGNSIVCRECGIPKPIHEFAEGSVVCQRCVPRVLARQSASVSPEDLRKTRFDIALDELRRTGDPAIPTGVRKAHEILKKSSAEIIAEMINETCYGIGKAPDGSEIPVPKGDFKIRARFLELFQRQSLNTMNP